MYSPCELFRIMAMVFNATFGNISTISCGQFKQCTNNIFLHIFYCNKCGLSIKKNQFKATKYPAT